MTEQGLPAEPGLSLAHIGINCADEESARQTAAALCGLLGLEYRPGEKSIFAGSIVECMKPPLSRPKRPHRPWGQRPGEGRLLLAGAGSRL